MHLQVLEEVVVLVRGERHEHAHGPAQRRVHQRVVAAGDQGGFLRKKNMVGTGTTEGHICIYRGIFQLVDPKPREGQNDLVAMKFVIRKEDRKKSKSHVHSDLQAPDGLADVEHGDALGLLARAAQQPAVPQGLDAGRVLLDVVVHVGGQPKTKINSIRRHQVDHIF